MNGHKYDETKFQDERECRGVGETLSILNLKSYRKDGKLHTYKALEI